MEDDGDIEKELLKYFKTVHQEIDINRLLAINKILPHIRNVITDDHNQLLLHPISLQEVELAMKQLQEGKAPSPDGFTSNFFHRFWDVIKEEVWQVVEEFITLH